MNRAASPNINPVAPIYANHNLSKTFPNIIMAPNTIIKQPHIVHAKAIILLLIFNYFTILHAENMILCFLHVVRNEV